MEDILSTFGSREGKGEKLNKILSELRASCNILAVIIADWQGLSFASKLPDDVNEEEISATTLFTLEGAEGTRRELERSLLGEKISYLIMVTERKSKPAYLILFPIENLGYIACISHIREDMGVIIQNMRTAARKAAAILREEEDLKDKVKSVEQLITPKYDQLMKKLEALKNVKLPFLQTPIQRISQQESPSVLEAPSIAGPPLPPEIPLEFVSIETEIEPLEPEILPNQQLIRFRVEFSDSKNIKYTVVLDATNELEAELRIKEKEAFHPITIINVTRLDLENPTESQKFC
jgi:predicted regulator of Ras-like GTPase activity (Roadblock/LC7/MglB family)